MMLISYSCSTCVRDEIDTIKEAISEALKAEGRPLKLTLIGCCLLGNETLQVDRSCQLISKMHFQGAMQA